MRRFPLPDRVSRLSPCPVCGHGSWCLAYREDGAAICARVPSRRAISGGKGFVGYLHKKESPMERVPASPPIDWKGRCKRWAADLTPGLRSELEGSLGLPAGATKLVPGVGWSSDGNGGHWTVPYRGGDGNVIGLTRRYRDGRKMSLGRNGLVLTRIPLGETAFVVEGFSDAAAMAAAGLCAIGRPSNRTGGDMVGEYLKRFRGLVVVMGEWDEKDDGLFPGLTGMVAVADEVRGTLHRHDRDAGQPLRRVIGRMPPQGFKDVRAWFNGNGFDGGRMVAGLKLSNRNEV